MRVTFHINFHTVWGQKIGIVGSIPQLGLWEPASGKELHYVENGNWELQLDLPADVQEIEYRYFLCVEGRYVSEGWERSRRVVFDKQSESYSLFDHWQTYPADPVFYTSAFAENLLAHPADTSKLISHSPQKLIIKVYASRVEKDQYVAITGNQPCLGEWDPDKALSLSFESYPEWSIELDAADLHFPLEYKFLIREKNTGNLLYWEAGENRVLYGFPLEDKQTIRVSGLTFRYVLPPWKCAGTVIPVFSLRSENSFGVGDLGDLYKMIDWAKLTGQQIIQVLPMNDTTMSHTWRDSYPYSAISIYALHPMYISLSWLGELKDKPKRASYARIQEELNSLHALDYEAVNRYKQAYCRDFFKEEGDLILASSSFKAFVADNESWLMPYAGYCYLRDTRGTSDFSQWGKDSVYNRAQIRRLCAEGGKAWNEISFYYFLQYILHIQFEKVSGHARENGVVLKGDLPIGINRTSVEAWTEPHYFNMEMQAGAPPDDFSAIGQNWSFPTYKWDVMEKDNFSWWKKRFAKMGDYFDCFRIDHILGFFRIWEIPFEYVEGLCGHFNPALPLTAGEIEQYGLPFDVCRFTVPRIHRKYLFVLFDDLAEEVENTYLLRTESDYVTLKPFCDTQRKIQHLFAGRTDALSLRVKQGLFVIANEVLFLRDPANPDKFHPRISAGQSYNYRDLNSASQYAFDRLYWDFFYHRHNEFWKKQAMNRLTPLVASTDMLVCGEDLGMIPQSVPEVMDRLQILSLEIERMPKASDREFTDMCNLPYLSVCTTSTHDMSPLRNWWTEDRAKTQRYYNNVLLRSGEAPEECTSELVTQILANHLSADSMLVIIPLQDWFAIDDTIKQSDITAERINVPANPDHYWQYRMHITLEELMNATPFNNKITELIKKNARL